MNKPHKHAEKIKAWADGAEIEHYCPMSKRWFDAGDNPKWFKNVEYRVKPQPKVVPFELVKDAEQLIGKAIKHKLSSKLYLITTVTETSIYVPSSGWYSPSSLLIHYTFLDGLPCGKYVKE